MTPKSVLAVVAAVREAYPDQPQVTACFGRCFPDTLDKAIAWLPNGGAFVVTGDIPAMWLRDSTAQLWPYLMLCREDMELRRVVAGVLLTQARQLRMDAYANAFNQFQDGAGHAGDQPERHPGVWERKFELDSLCYPIRLAHAYWRVSGDTAALSDELQATFRRVLEVMRTEQRHMNAATTLSGGPTRPTPTICPTGAKGQPTAYTGMIWSAFRPSDDACALNYNVPGNMLAVSELGHLAELAREVWRDAALANEAENLRSEIERGIEQHGVYDHPQHGRIYAYEVDGLGNHVLMDDANVPSLLSVPYIGYRPATDMLYQRTRAFVLSDSNPYFYSGQFAEGVGSPHTAPGYVWPLALAMRGLTSADAAEQQRALEMLTRTTADTNLMHESFDPSNPHAFSREWFGWANSLFCELALSRVAVFASIA